MSKEAGSDNVISAKINDANGATITVAASATPQAVFEATLMLKDVDNTEGTITYTPASGKFTVAKPAGFGKYKVTAIAGDLIGTNSSVLDLELVHTPFGGAAAQFGIGARKTELAAATRHGTFCAVGFVTLDEVGDTVELQLRVGTNGHAGTFRDLMVMLEKVAEV